MKTLYNISLYLKELDEETYNKLIDFLNDNDIGYNEEGFEEYVVDTRSEARKHQDMLWEEADIRHDEMKMEGI